MFVFYFYSVMPSARGCIPRHRGVFPALLTILRDRGKPGSSTPLSIPNRPASQVICLKASLSPLLSRCFNIRGSKRCWEITCSVQITASLCLYRDRDTRMESPGAFLLPPSLRVTGSASHCLLIICYSQSQKKACQMFAEGEGSRFKTQVNSLVPILGFFSSPVFCSSTKFYWCSKLTLCLAYLSGIHRTFFSPSKYLVPCSFLG